MLYYVANGVREREIKALSCNQSVEMAQAGRGKEKSRRAMVKRETNEHVSAQAHCTSRGRRKGTIRKMEGPFDGGPDKQN